MLKRKTKRFFQIVMICTPIMTVSCIDSDYDLNKKIDMTVSINGEGLTIPIGYTDSVKLSSIIDTATSEALILDDNQIYQIEKKDDIETVNIEVTKPTIRDITPVFKGVNVQFESSENVKENTLVAYVEDASDFEINEEIDEAIKTLKVIQWEEPVHMTYTMTFGNFPGTYIRKGISLANLQVKFPEFIQFAPEEGVVDGVLTLDGVYDPNTNKPYVRTLKVIGMDFTKIPEYENGVPINNQTLFIDRSLAPVIITGFIATTPTELINPDQLHPFTIMPSVTLDNMEVSRMTGRFDPEIDNVNETASLNLGEDLDFLKDETTHLDLANPVFRITMTNTVDAPVDMDLTMTGEDAQGTPISGSEVHVDLSGERCLAPALNGNPVTTVFYVSRKGAVLPPNQADTVYRNIIEKNLNRLTQRLPDNIHIDMAARVNQNEDHHINLDKNLDITGHYNVSVPLIFEALDIVYSDTIKNLQDDLSDFLNKTKQMELIVKGNLYNGIPLPMFLQAKAMDPSGKELPTDKVSVEVYVNGKKDGLIAAGKENGETVNTEIEIHIEAIGDDLRQLDMIEWCVQATEESGSDDTGTEGIVLKSDQYLQFKDLKATVKQITLDLN